MGELSYKVVFYDLPCTVKGFVLKKNDFYTIVLNSKLNCIQNTLTYEHELKHILNEDFDNEIDVDFLEKLRHELIS